ISTMLQNLEKMAKQRELTDKIKITLNVADGRGSQSIQNEQVDRFLSAGYDAICVNIVDRTAAAVIIDKAKNANIPVIFFNREPVEEDMMRWDKVYYVGAEAGKSGVLQGELVIDAYQQDPDAIDRNRDGVLQYVMLEGEPGHQDALLRTEYSVKVLSAANIVTEKLANDTANWNRGQAASKMSQWIEQFGGAIEVVFSNNDDMALGAIDACQIAKLSPLPFIVGIDATPPAAAAVRDGSLRGTVFNDSEGQSKAVLDIALALARGSDPAQAVTFKNDKYVWLPYTKVTAENIDEIVPEKNK
ncbi:MAG: galactose ABC transporter substrate-binding protein, partial [Oscillospiraceae bacterium]